VETPYQREFLSTHGCDHLQGYLFSRPIPSSEVVTFFHTRPPLTIKQA
jgi:EAL domain-containing protein (putative c-di-GMP-specific phosphodiesterase class I)